MLMLELPHINVLSKMDLLDEEQQESLRMSFSAPYHQRSLWTIIPKYKTCTT